MGNSRGASIATVLMVMAVLLTLSLTLASQGTFHLRLATKQSNAEQARNLAESTLTMTIDRLNDNQGFGAGTTTAADAVRVRFDATGPEGVLTFHSTLANQLGVPVSVNNLENDASVALSDGRTVPANSAYLAARAEINGVSSVMEAFLRVPVYRNAVATSGSLSSTGGLFVASVDNLFALRNGVAGVAPEELLPGHVAANSMEETVLDSTSLSNETLITGDARAGGNITLGAFTTVQGSVRQNAPPESLPDLNITDYDNQNFAGLSTIGQQQLNNPGNPLDPVVLEGPWRRQGDLSILNGLDLNGGYLYVNGDLTVRSGLQGKGAIFATGDIRVEGAAAFSTNNTQALVAGGDLTVIGGANPSARESAYFTGVSYNEGNVRLENVTQVGSVVNNSSQETTVEMTRVNSINVPSVVDFEWDFGGAPAAQMPRVGPGSFHFGVPGQDYNDSDNLSPFFDPQTDSFDIPATAREIEVSLYKRESGSTLREFEVRSFSTVQEVANFLHSERDSQGNKLPINAVWSPQERAQGFLNPDNQNNIDPTVQDWLDVITPEFEAYQDQLHQRIINSDILYRQTRQESLKKGKFQLDPSQFLQFSEEVRIVWIKERKN